MPRQKQPARKGDGAVSDWHTDGAPTVEPNLAVEELRQTAFSAALQAQPPKAGATTTRPSSLPGMVFYRPAAYSPPSQPGTSGRPVFPNARPAALAEPLPVVKSAPVLDARGENKAQRGWRKVLNSELLLGVINSVRGRLPKEVIGVFMEKVASQFCPDYNQWVEPEKEIWLRRIMEKCRKADYSNHAEFLTDVCQIAANSRAYNSEGHGIYRGPAVVLWGEQLQGAFEEELAGMSDRLEAMEASIRNPLCEPPPTSLATSGPANKGRPKQLGVSKGPSPMLPKGIRHVLRLTDSKPQGWVQYEALCPNPAGHGPRVRALDMKVDRLDKLMAYFEVHAACCPEWAEFGRRRDESETDWKDRLRQTFTFSKAPPPVNPADPTCTPSTVDARGLGDKMPAYARHSPPLPRRKPGRPSANGVYHSSDLHPIGFQRQTITDAFVPPFAPPEGPVHWPQRQFPGNGQPLAQHIFGGTLMQRPGGTLPAPNGFHHANGIERAQNGSGQGGQSLRRPELLGAPPAKRIRIINAPELAKASRSAAQALPQVAPASGNREEDPEVVVAQLVERLLSAVAPPEALGASNAAPPGPAVQHLRDGAAALSAGKSQELPSASESPEAPETDMEDAGSPAATSGRDDMEASSAAPSAEMSGGGREAGSASDEGQEREANSAISQGENADGSPATHHHNSTRTSGAVDVFREQEIGFLERVLARPKVGSILLLTGPAGSGKSTILQQISARRNEAGTGVPVVIMDCRIGGSVAESLRLACDRAEEESSTELPEGLSVDGYASEEKVFLAVTAWFQGLALQHKRLFPNARETLPAFIVDHMDSLKLEQQPKFLDFLRFIGPQKHIAHVVMAASHPMFPQVYAPELAGVSVEVISDLSRDASRRLFERQSRGLGADEFARIHAVCGGNLGLWARFWEGLETHGDLDSALEAIWRDAAKAVQRGLERATHRTATLDEWTREDYVAVARALLSAEHNVMRVSAVAEMLEAASRRNGAQVLRDMAAKGLVAFRSMSKMATDLPPSVHGDFQEAIVCFPNAAHLYFWRLPWSAHLLLQA